MTHGERVPLIKKRLHSVKISSRCDALLRLQVGHHLGDPTDLAGHVQRFDSHCRDQAGPPRQNREWLGIDNASPVRRFKQRVRIHACHVQRIGCRRLPLRLMMLVESWPFASRMSPTGGSATSQAGELLKMLLRSQRDELTT